MLDENPGRRGGCWLNAEALSPRWGEQAGSEVEGGKSRHGQPELIDQATGARLEETKTKCHTEKRFSLKR